MEASEYKRNCPECRREIHYISRDSFNHAKPWKKCRYCCNVITDTDLFYIDGYDKEKNVVLEFDSKYHRRFGQREKDLIRQQKIIDILKPKRFWRFDSESKQIKNAIGEKFDAQENAPF